MGGGEEAARKEVSTAGGVGCWNRYDFEYDDVSGALSTNGPARCLIEVKACAMTRSPAEARFYLTANELDAMRGVQQRQDVSDGSGLPTAFVIVLVASPLHNPQMVRLFVFHFRTTRSLYVLPTYFCGGFSLDDPSTEKRSRRSSLPVSSVHGQPCRAFLHVDPTLSGYRALLNGREIASR
jgi:hypothetical protein